MLWRFTYCNGKSFVEIQKSNIQNFEAQSILKRQIFCNDNSLINENKSYY